MLRADFGLTYAAVGTIATASFVASSLVEPLLGVLADTRLRGALVVGGGLAFAALLVAAADAGTFAVLLVALALLSPASAAFVSLAQVTLMDHAPAERERSMARWTLAGAAGAVAGPVALAAAVALGLGWRGLLVALAAAALALALAVAARGLPPRPADGASNCQLLAGLGRALRLPGVVRWLVLLELADLLVDVFASFLALYLAEDAGLGERGAALGFGVWAAAGLAGGAGVLRLLRRVGGLAYVRASAAASLALLPAFLLVPGGAKLVPLAALGALTAGWYPVLKARLYDALDGRSGAAVALGSAAGLLLAPVPPAVGAAADAVGLTAALLLLAVGPLALVVALRQSASGTFSASGSPSSGSGAGPPSSSSLRSSSRGC